MTTIDPLRNLNQIRTDIESLLQIERVATINNRADLEACIARRKEIRLLTRQLRSELDTLEQSYSQISRLPNMDLVNWAEDILSMRDLAILVIDTTSLNDNADIIRFYAIDASGELLLDIVVQPQRERDPNTAYTGISQQEIDQAPTLAEAWERIMRDLKGCFVVSFNFSFLEDRLNDNIAHYGLPRLPFRAEDLMEQAKSYFNIQRYGYKLSDCCARIGHTLPSPALAPDRAAGCLEFLKAMANGITNVSTPVTADMPLLDDPF
jgi:hypothetical protein